MTSQHAMPILMINMGAEMTYVLQQRLNAQNIPQPKVCSVLSDVIRTMFNESFVNQLFEAHAIYSPEATLEIFDRLAHSSIMRLNSTSMGKLFDLMTMGFKYQLINCRFPEEILDVTRNHIDNLLAIGNEEVQTLLQSTHNLVESTYGRFSKGELINLKQTLFGFFQDRRVKVSILLQDRVQRKDGMFVVNCNGKLPPNVEEPGLVRCFSKGGEEYSVNLAVLEKFCILPGPPDLTTLGDNLYAIERAEVPKTLIATDESKTAESKSNTSPDDQTPIPSDNAADELNFLADLIKPPPASASSTPPLSFDFDALIVGDGSGGSFQECGAEKESAHTVTIDGKSDRKSMDQRLRELDFDDDFGVSHGASKTQDDGDDLLDLMDEFSDSKTSD